MRRFILDRVEDVSGVSGTGKVAEGVEFSTGKVAVTWVTEHRSTTVYDSMAEVEAIHGHGGRTVIKYLDLSPEMEKVSKKIADGMEAGLKSGIRSSISPIELAFAKLETAGVKGALYQSEKERVKLELELAEASAAVERQDALLEKWGKVLVERDAEIARLKESRKLAEERHIEISDTLAERDAKIERLGKALADANERSIAYQKENEQLRKAAAEQSKPTKVVEQTDKYGYTWRVFMTERDTLMISRSYFGSGDVCEGTLQQWADAFAKTPFSRVGALESRVADLTKENERLTYNLWAIEKIAAPAA